MSGMQFTPSVPPNTVPQPRCVPQQRFRENAPGSYRDTCPAHMRVYIYVYIYIVIVISIVTYTEGSNKMYTRFKKGRKLLKL